MKTYEEMAQSVFERRDEIEKKQKTKRKRIAKLTASVACLAIIVLIGAGIFHNYTPPTPVQQAEDAIYPGIKDWYGPGEEPTGEASNDVNQPLGEETTSTQNKKILVSSFEDKNFYSYETPEIGSYFCSVPLKKAIEEYGDTAIYQVRVRVFSADNEQISDADELEKVADILYSLGYTSAIDKTNGYPSLTLHATEGQLENFKADDEHGYFFFLYNE